MESKTDDALKATFLAVRKEIYNRFTTKQQNEQQTASAALKRSMTERERQSEVIEIDTDITAPGASKKTNHTVTDLLIKKPTHEDFVVAWIQAVLDKGLTFDFGVRPLRLRLLYLTASIRPRLTSSDPKKKSPFAHAFGRRNKFPVRSLVRPSKVQPRSPSLGSVTTICRQKNSTDTTNPPFNSLARSIRSSHAIIDGVSVPLQGEPLLSGQNSPVNYMLTQRDLAETVDITHDIPAHLHVQRHLHDTSPRILDLTSSSPNPPVHYLSSRFRSTTPFVLT
jgi:hypothetical protein